MLNVFLVEDEHLIRKGVIKMIPWEANGFVISGEACDGEQALEMIRPDNTDIIITDIRMPIMDGISLTEEIKKKYPGMEVIILTGYGDFPNVQLSLRNGAADFLLKPVDFKELMEALLRIRTRIERRQQIYPYKLERQLLVAIKSVNTEVVEHSINALFDELEASKVDVTLLSSIVSKVILSIRSECTVLQQLSDHLLEEEQLPNSGSISEWKEWFVTMILEAMKPLSDDGDDCILESIKNYVSQHYNEDITLSSIAKVFYLNSSYLSRIFKSRYGKNYSQFLTEVRIENAKKLLTESNLLVHKISTGVGFNDYQYFTRVFRSMTGYQPNQYRQIVRGKDVLDAE